MPSRPMGMGKTMWWCTAHRDTRKSCIPTLVGSYSLSGFIGWSQKKSCKDLSSWWFFSHPFEKYARQNGFIFPNFRGENKKSLSCHHLVLFPPKDFFGPGLIQQKGPPPPFFLLRLPPWWCGVSAESDFCLRNPIHGATCRWFFATWHASCCVLRPQRCRICIVADKMCFFFNVTLHKTNSKLAPEK